MRYKPGDVVRAVMALSDGVMALSDGRSPVDKGDVCIVRASFDITAIARYWDDIPTTPKRATTQRPAAKRRSGLVMCSVIHLRGGSNMLIPEVQLEPVGKTDDAI